MEKTSAVKPIQFKFVSDNYSKYLQCPLCQKLLIQPMRLHPCGHTFCNACILIKNTQNSNSKTKLCYNQSCKKKYTVAQQDITAERLIDQLKVKCLNDGCPWKGDYEQYRKYHVNECKLKDGLDHWLKSLVKGINKQNQQQEAQRQQQSAQSDEKQPRQIVKLNQNFINQKQQLQQKQAISPILKENSSFFTSIFQNCSQAIDEIMKKIIKKPEKNN